MLRFHYIFLNKSFKNKLYVQEVLVIQYIFLNFYKKNYNGTEAMLQEFNNLISNFQIEKNEENIAKEGH